MVIIFWNFLVPPKGCTKPIHLPPLKRPNTIQHHERSGLKSIPQGANKTWYLLPNEIKVSGSFESFKSEIKYLGCWQWHRLYAIHISNLVKFTYIDSTLVFDRVGFYWLVSWYLTLRLKMMEVVFRCLSP